MVKYPIIGSLLIALTANTASTAKTVSGAQVVPTALLVPNAQEHIVDSDLCSLLTVQSHKFNQKILLLDPKSNLLCRKY